MKSNVSTFLEVIDCIYHDAVSQCTADVSDLRDLLTIRSRVENEGVSFLTILLPTFCQDFEKSLDQGFVDSLSFRNFRKYKAIPAFLRGMLSRIFDIETGRIINENSYEIPILVCSVRQICLAFKKIEMDCTPLRERAAYDKFIEVENALSSFRLREDLHTKFRMVSSLLWSTIASSISLDDCIPKHGPGATAEHISGNQKYVWRYWHARLEPYFPIIGNAVPYSIMNSDDIQRELRLLTVLEEHEEIPLRMCSVPKTLKTPRIIAIEPSCMQFAQQGIRTRLQSGIESYWLTSGHVNFRDQSINQSLAMKSSSTGQLATIDLSDASDRIPLSLALDMFECVPVLRGAIESCRSRYAQIPDGPIIGPLQKFASMGSSLCFPIESMYFYTVCVVALLDSQNLPATRLNIYDVTRDAYVYGDDIIVPSVHAGVVLDYLQEYNCKVNTTKTFYTGKFRESCGVDAYDGELVTPTYLRALPPKNRRDASSIISWISTANLFYKRGYWRTSSIIFKMIERLIGILPYVSDDSGCLGRYSYLGYQTINRWNVDHQTFEVKGWCPEPVYCTDELDGYDALSKSLSLLGDPNYDPLNVRDVHHLERSALHHAVALKRGWVPLH